MSAFSPIIKISSKHDHILDKIIKILIAGLVVYFLAWFLPDISVDNYWTAILVALLISIIDITIKPLIEFVTFPLTIITLGLWLLVINIFLIYFIDFLLPGFHVTSKFWALVFAFGCSLLGAGINLGDDKK